MFCGKCGKQLPDNAWYCDGCGSPVNQNELTQGASTVNVPCNQVPNTQGLYTQASNTQEPNTQASYAQPAYAQPPYTPPQPVYAPVEAQKSGGNGKNGIIAALCVAVVALVLVLVFALRGTTPAETETVSQPRQETATQSQQQETEAVDVEMVEIQEELPIAIWAGSNRAVMDVRENRWDIDYENPSGRLSTDGLRSLMLTICGEPAQKLDTVDTDGPCMCFTLHYEDDDNYIVIYLWEDGKVEFAGSNKNDSASYEVLGCYQVKPEVYQELAEQFEKGELTK